VRYKEGNPRLLCRIVSRSVDAISCQTLLSPSRICPKRFAGSVGIRVLAFLASIEPTFWIIALNVKERDFRYVIPFLGFWFSLGCMSHWSGWARAPSARSGNCFIPSTQWSAFPLVHSRRSTPLYLPDLAVSVVVAGLFLWFGIHRLLKTGEALPTLFEFSLGRHSRRLCHSVRTRGRNFTVDCAQAR
jgi:hypothetical protein